MGRKIFIKSSKLTVFSDKSAQIVLQYSAFLIPFEPVFLGPLEFRLLITPWYPI